MTKDSHLTRCSIRLILIALYVYVLLTFTVKIVFYCLGEKIVLTTLLQYAGQIALSILSLVGLFFFKVPILMVMTILQAGAVLTATADLIISCTQLSSDNKEVELSSKQNIPQQIEVLINSVVLTGLFTRLILDLRRKQKMLDSKKVEEEVELKEMENKDNKEKVEDEI